MLALVQPAVHAQSLRERMLAAEDARVSTEAAIAPLLEGLRGSDPALGAQAVRALGRFEQPRFVPQILPLLASPTPRLRSEAANAVGQSLAGIKADAAEPQELPAAAAALLSRLNLETDEPTRGIVAETLGRLPYRRAELVSEVEAALRTRLGVDATRPATMAEVGAAKGLAALIRLQQKRQPPDAATLQTLRDAATVVSPNQPLAVLRRRTAWVAVIAAAAGDLPTVENGLADTDAQVRRLALVALGTPRAPDARAGAWLDRSLHDPSFVVRTEAVRVYSRMLQAGDCAPLIAATSDANVHVQLAAIDALGSGCTAGPSPDRRLESLADSLPDSLTSRGPGRVAWHAAAHALVSLAQVSKAAAATRLPRFAEHGVWQVRMYAAKAAAHVGDTSRLERLAVDANDNVRQAAVVALRELRGHAADEVFIRALAGGAPSAPRGADYELVLAAAEALEGSPNRDQAVPALLRAFARQSAERRDTSRDSRMALLHRIRELGTPIEATLLQPCLADPDAVVAAECASILQAWTGSRPALRSPQRLAAPAPMRLPARARISMRDGGAFVIRFFTEDAPFTVSRFAALAGTGYYNGLTMHRVVPNFVLQGGSPGANEYAGDASYLRDELGLASNARGTVGTSTRGRDTGDAQFFVNLLDNPRLDHEFTVFAEITSGLDVVDAVLEGDVIERVELLP